MQYLGFFIFFFSMLHASELSDWSAPSTEWDDEMYQKRLAGPLQIGAATSWHTITRARPQKTFTPDQLKHAKGMARHLMTSLQETMKDTHIKWRPYKSQVLVKAIACVNQSEWFAVRDMVISLVKKLFCYDSPDSPRKEEEVDFHFLGKNFFVLGNTPKEYRGGVYELLECFVVRMSVSYWPRNIFCHEELIPSWVMGVKFKRADFPNNSTFRFYLETRTPYAFDPGHFWITLQCVQLLHERSLTPSPFPIFRKLLEFEQPHYLIKLVQTPVPRKFWSDNDKCLQIIKDAPLDPQGPSGYWLKNVLLKRLECFQTRSDWSFEFEHTFRRHLWLWAYNTESYGITTGLISNPTPSNQVTK